MTRYKTKEKKNRKQGFDQRVRWYENGDDIRIEIEDSEGSVNCFPHSREDAEHLWFMVTKQCMTEQGGAFIADLRKITELKPSLGLNR